jgi:HSP20 family protein
MRTLSIEKEQIAMNLIPWRTKNRENDQSSRELSPRSHELSPAVDFRREMDRLFDSFFREPFWPSSSEGVFGGLTAWSPSLDVAETDDEVAVRAEIPGVDPKDLNISVSGSRLVISGEKKETKESKEKDFHRRESYYGSFTREVQLPSGIDANNIDATYADGVLTVRLKKSPEAAAKKIPVKAS